MDENNHKEYTEGDSLYILGILVLMSNDWDRLQSNWNDFEYQLLHANRFFAENEFLSVVKEFGEYVSYTIPQGTVLYRSRTMVESADNSFEEIIKDVCAKRGLSFPKESGVHFGANTIELLSCLQDTLPCDSVLSSCLTEAARQYKQRRFKGFGRKESSAPPYSLCPAGRANPSGIRYLYLSESKETSIYEVRPALNQGISVAKLRTKRPLFVYDFCEPYYIKDEKLASEYAFVREKFSQPNYNEPLKYITTQYIAEEIKRMGFDGIRFCSSVYRDGVNIVLFDPEDCDVLSSEVVEVDDIRVEYDTPSLLKTITKEQSSSNKV